MYLSKGIVYPCSAWSNSLVYRYVQGHPDANRIHLVRPVVTLVIHSGIYTIILSYLEPPVE